MREKQLEKAHSPLVMAIDVGSSSVRALLYDINGKPVPGSEHQVGYSLKTTPDGGSTVDPDQLVSIVYTCIDHCISNADIRQGQIRAVALTTFWHSLMGLRQDKTPATPVLMWADKRSGEDAIALASILDAERVHTETGCRLHSSYWPAKLRWLHRTQPEVYDVTETWVSFADYLSWTVHNHLATSISMASGTGLLHSSSAHWHPEMLSALCITSNHLPPLTDRDMALPPPREELRLRWPALADAAWFPAIGDGAAANVGAGCVGASRVALTIGTSGAMRAVVQDQTDHEEVTRPLSPRLWQYRLDRRHRVPGGALSNGGNITTWFADLIQTDDFTSLARDAADIAPDGHGLTVLPFFAGERSPSWNDHLTGAILGLRLGTSAGAIYRAFLEATAYRFAAIYEDLKHLVTPEHQIRANGAAALGSPLWMQILADTLGHPITSLGAEAEASARGAALCALESIRLIDDLREPEIPIVTTYQPNPALYEVYAAGRQRLERYEHVIDAMTKTTPAPSVKDSLH